MFGFFRRGNWPSKLPLNIRAGISEKAKANIDDFVQDYAKLSDEQVAQLVLSSTHADNVAMNEIHTALVLEFPNESEAILASKTFELYVDRFFALFYQGQSFSPLRKEWLLKVTSELEEIEARCKTLKDAKIEYKKIKFLADTSSLAIVLISAIDLAIENHPGI